MKNYARVNDLLEKRKIHDAFALLSNSEIIKKAPHLADLLSKQEQNYKFLIHYMAQGVSDSSRHEMLNEIIATIHFINDSLLRLSVSTDSSNLYYSTLRLGQVRRNNIADALSAVRSTRSVAELEKEAGTGNEARMSYDNALINLFETVWTMFGDTVEAYNLLSTTLTDPTETFDVKSQIISALLLGNLDYFDKKAFKLLLDLYESHPEPRIAARTLIALVFILLQHKQRVMGDTSIRNRLVLLNDNIFLYRQLRECIMQIIRAHDTQRISNKMQKEVLPELMKLQPEFLEKLKSISESADIEMLEANPEWDEILNKNGLGDKLKELTDIQMEGGDVMMMAFSNLKSFPFFNKVSNWFLPFHASHHEVSNNQFDNSDVLNQLLDMEGVMCDSDKYSFAFSLQHMPKGQRKMMMAKMNEQMDQLREIMESKRLKSSIPEFDEEVIRFVRDLYRFFKLFPRKKEFIDIFSDPIDFINLPVIGELMSDSEILNLVGEFYFKRGYYKEALHLLKKIDSQENSDSLLWEKIGYCYGALGEPIESLKWYKKAELLHPESKWLIKKMAVTYHLIGDSYQAAEYFKRALDNDPENESLLMSCANTNLELGLFREALSYLYHINYLKPDSVKIWRLIADAETKIKDYKKALTFYDRLKLYSDSQQQDWFNSGKVHFLAGNIPAAIADLKVAFSKANQLDVNMDKEIETSSKMIEDADSDLETWQLILDYLRYNSN